MKFNVAINKVLRTAEESIWAILPQRPQTTTFFFEELCTCNFSQ